MNNELEQLIQSIYEETKAPICASYEYDPTPTAEERLARIADMISQYRRERIET